MRDLVRSAHSAAPEEICGFILYGGTSFLPVDNCHPQPEQHFTMNEGQMLNVLTSGETKVDGIYHSHPKGNKYPSVNDADLMRLYPQFRFWIVTYNNVYEWRLVNDEPAPVRRDGTTGLAGMAYPLLEAPAAV